MNPNKCPQCGESLMGCKGHPSPNLIITSPPIEKFSREQMGPVPTIEATVIGDKVVDKAGNEYQIVDPPMKRKPGRPRKTQP